jgi:hypothetical protein
MKTKRLVQVCLCVMVWFAFAIQPARAGDVDCTIDGTGGGPACAFGVVFSGPTSFPLFGGGIDATVTETVYNTGGGVFTYVFTVTNNGAGNPLHSMSTSTLTLGPNLDKYDPSLKYGIVTDTSLQTGGVDEDGSVTCTSGGFCFGLNSLNVTLFGAAGLTNGGKNFTFYAQGPDPTLGNFNVSNGGPSNTVNLLTPFTEPNALIQLGAGLLFIFGALFVGRLRHQAA